jgi:hypothetical protein
MFTNDKIIINTIWYRFLFFFLFCFIYNFIKTWINVYIVDMTTIAITNTNINDEKNKNLWIEINCFTIREFEYSFNAYILDSNSSSGNYKREREF